MQLHRPHVGFVLAWGGNLGAPERERRTDREFAPLLDALEAIEPAPVSTGLPGHDTRCPVTTDLLQRVLDGLASI